MKEEKEVDEYYSLSQCNCARFETYTFPVNVPTEDDEEVNQLPFNELSKSGKIVNAYNALIMADRVSRGK